MSKLYNGSLVGIDLKIAVVTARFNSFITNKLFEGAMETLKRHGVNPEDIDQAWVPGAFEIPLIAEKLATSKKYDAIITLGAVIRGATSHYDYVCTEAARGIANASIQSGKPVIFGVLTTETIEQAIERTGAKGGNKGSEAALAAIEMANLIKEIQ